MMTKHWGNWSLTLQIMCRQLFAVLMVTAWGVAFTGTASAQPGVQLDEVTPPDSGFGVSVAFDGEFLYYTNFSGNILHRIKRDGSGHQDFTIVGPAGVNAFSFDVTRNAFWAADSSGLGIWLIPKPGPMDVSVIATLQFAIDPATDRPGDCDNASLFGANFCLSLIDGLAYDGVTDTIWYSPDASQRIYHYNTDAAPDMTAELIDFVDVNDPPNDMAPECGEILPGVPFNYSSGVAAGTNDLWLMANGCPRYFQYSKMGTKIDSFLHGLTRAEDDECDNITFAPLNALWVRDVDGPLVAFEQPIECPFGGGEKLLPEKARMTGGGETIATTPLGAPVHLGLMLHCDAAVKPNRLQVNWHDANGDAHRFHMTSMDSATCSDDPLAMPKPPDATFDTHEGKGTGRFNGVPGATAEWKFVDGGEPSTNDRVDKLIIKDAAGNIVLTVMMSPLVNGDFQAHQGQQGPDS